MSKPEIAVQLVQSEESGKHRVLVTVHKDDWLDLSFVLNAEQASQLSLTLAEIARQARGRSIILPGGGTA
jgi:hypothetical protein